jgi:hypothetical protein
VAGGALVFLPARLEWRWRQIMFPFPRDILLQAEPEAELLSSIHYQASLSLEGINTLGVEIRNIFTDWTRRNSSHPEANDN